jgi:hypothetical protein
MTEPVVLYSVSKIFDCSEPMNFLNLRNNLSGYGIAVDNCSVQLSTAWMPLCFPSFGVCSFSFCSAGN